MQTERQLALSKRLSGKQWLLFAALLAFALYLRAFELAQYPQPRQTNDEYHYLWAGLSLIEDGKATSWSALKGYRAIGMEPKLVQLVGRKLPMVSPALDHPPLFSLLAGAFAKLTCAKSVLVRQADGSLFKTWEIHLDTARYLTLILFAASFFFLFQLAQQAFSFPVACYALLFYAVNSHAVFHNRLLVTENFSTPLFLLNLWYVQRYIDGRASRAGFATVTVLTTAAALLTKVIAVSQAAGVIAWLLYLRRPKDIIFPVLGVILGVALYCAYGWWQDWTVFCAILTHNAERFVGLSSFTRILTKPGVVHTNETNYLLMVGWIALFTGLFRKPKSGVLIAPAAYLLGYTFFAAVNEIYGWHIVPFYPFLCLALALWVARALRRGDLWDYTPLIVLLLPGAFDLFPLSAIGPWAYLLAICVSLGALALPDRPRRISVQVITVVVLWMLISRELLEIWVNQPKP